MFTRSAITTIGSTMRDIFVYTDEGVVIPNTKDMLREKWIAFERAAKVEAKRMDIRYGGGAANSAVTFARLGLNPRILTAVGDDATGLDCKLQLRREGVSLRLVQRIHDQQTGTSLIVNISDQMSHVALVHRGASTYLHITHATMQQVTTPWVYLTALGGNWKSSAEVIFRHVAKRKIKVAWNPGAEQLSSGTKTLSKYMSQCEVFIINHDEALELALHAKLVTGPTSARSLARLLSRYGATYTVVTDGHKGAFTQRGTKSFFQPAKIGKTVNKTGAGDAFGSGFVAGLIRFNDSSRALKLAMYNSHSVVGHIGAQQGILHSRDIQTLHI